MTSEHPEWASYFCRLAGLKRHERLAMSVFSNILRKTKTNDERFRFFAILLSAEIGYTIETLGDAQWTEEEIQKAVQKLLEQIGLTMGKLLGDGFRMQFQLEPKSFGAFGGSDL